MNYKTIKIGSVKNKRGIIIEPAIVYFNDKNVNAIKDKTNTFWIKESAMNPLIPTTNSWTKTATSKYKGTDGGIVSANSGDITNSQCYRAFDGKDTTCWNSRSSSNISTSNPHWIMYQFTKATSINMIKIKGNSTLIQGKVQGSNNGTDFVDIITIDVNDTDIYHMLDNNQYSDPYLYYRIIFTQNNSSWGDMGAIGGTKWYYFVNIYDLQFYKTV